LTVELDPPFRLPFHLSADFSEAETGDDVSPEIVVGDGSKMGCGENKRVGRVEIEDALLDGEDVVGWGQEG